MQVMPFAVIWVSGTSNSYDNLSNQSNFASTYYACILVPSQARSQPASGSPNCVDAQVLGGEEVLQLPPKTEELVAGVCLLCASVHLQRVGQSANCCFTLCINCFTRCLSTA